MRKILIWERKIQLAQQRGGSFYCVYTDPATGTPAFTVSYVKPVDAGWVVGAIRYLPDVPAVFPQERRSQLVAQVREADLGEFNNPNETFSKPDLFIFAFDRNGTLLANPYLPGTVGLNRLSDRDPYGEYPVPYILANAEQGVRFMCYFFTDPSADYRPVETRVLATGWGGSGGGFRDPCLTSTLFWDPAIQQGMPGTRYLFP